MEHKSECKKKLGFVYITKLILPGVMLMFSIAALMGAIHEPPKRALFVVLVFCGVAFMVGGVREFTQDYVTGQGLASQPDKAGD